MVSDGRVLPGGMIGPFFGGETRRMVPPFANVDAAATFQARLRTI